MDDVLNKAPSERWSTFLCACSLVYIISRVYYISLAPDIYTPPKYNELKTTKGVVQQEVLRGRKIKTMYTGGYPALAIKHDNVTDYYVCSAINYGICKIEDQKKYLSTDIYNVYIEVKWAEYMEKKLIYEIKLNNEIKMNYTDSIRRYKNGVDIKNEEIEDYKKDLIKGFVFFIITAYMGFKK